MAQICASNRKEENFDVCERLVSEAASLGAQLICLPEGCDFIPTSASEAVSMSENMDGPTIRRYSELAERENIWISLGGFHEKAETKDKAYITHIIIDNNGNMKAQYRKVHLFDTNYPKRMRESNAIESGDSPVVVDSPIGKLGLSVCFDLRFFELFRELRRLGAEVILVPAAFLPQTGAQWKPLLQCRAIETQSFILASAQTGHHSEKRSSYGHSLGISPSGKILLQFNEERNIQKTFEIDRNDVLRIREKFPFFDLRRDDLYRNWDLSYDHQSTTTRVPQ